MSRPHPDEGRAAHEAIRGSGLPATSSRNAEGICTGAWACDGQRHCVCWWDSPVFDSRCCQCGDPGDDLVPGVDYERASCPACGDPDCKFPPECQAALGTYPHPDDDDPRGFGLDTLDTYGLGRGPGR